MKNLYDRLLPLEQTTAAEREKIARLVMSWPSVVMYGIVRADVIPPGTYPIEMFVDNRESLDESEVTIYLSSLEDPSLCPAGKHVFTMLGPSFAQWPAPGSPGDRSPAYAQQKRAEAKRSSRCSSGISPASRRRSNTAKSAVRQRLNATC